MAEFRSSDVIFLDTNVYVYALENEDLLGKKARELFTSISEKKPHIYTSVLTVAEVLTGVFKKGLEARIEEYLEFISGNGSIKVLDIDRKISIASAQLRAELELKKKNKLKTPDSLQLACALSVGSNKFVTADKNIPKKIGGTRVLLLK